MLLPLALSDIARNFGRAHNPALRIREGGNGQGNIQQRAVLAASDGFIMVDFLAAADALHDAPLFVDPFGRGEQRDRLADSFPRSISKKPLGAGIPARGDALEIGADDGIVGGIDDRRSLLILASAVVFSEQRVPENL